MVQTKLANAEAARSEARLADIELGLSGPDAELWERNARQRIAALESDFMDYGLMPHEEGELQRLRALVADRPLTLRDYVSGAVGLVLAIALMMGGSMAMPS